MSFDAIGNASGTRYHIVVAPNYNIQELAQMVKCLAGSALGRAA